MTKPGHSTVFLDATEWGEVLALADAPYLQGVEAVDGGREGNDTCGQATVFDIVERLNAEPVEEAPGPGGVDEARLRQLQEVRRRLGPDLDLPADQGQGIEGGRRRHLPPELGLFRA